MSKTMFCTNCGNSVDAGATHCANCNTPVNRTAGQPIPSNTDTGNTGVSGATGQLAGRLLGGRYQLGELIGSGGMGEIYRARRTHIGDSVAVKVLRSDVVSNEKTRQRFYREARAAALLHHPNVVVIHDFGEDNEGAGGQLAYIVMELLDGRSLRQVLADEGALDAVRVYGIMRQACAALEAGHRSGVIHRDIKPDNIILLRHDEDTDHVKLLDFGIAKLRDQALDTLSAENNLTNVGTVIGTPNYMSPEQCQGEEADARSDIYSLGIVLYEMLTGTMPFIAKTATAVAVKHVTEKPRPLRELQPALPAEVEAVVLQALEKAPEARPQSMLELARAFAAALKQASVTTVALSGKPGTKPLRIDTPRTDEVMAATLIKPPPATPIAKENDGFKTSIAAPQETGEAPQRLTAVLPQGHDFKTTVAAEPSAGDYKTTVAAEPLPSGDDFKTTVAADPLPSTGDYKTTIAADPIAGDYKTTIAADPIAGDYKTTVAVEPLPGADEFKTLVGAPLAFDTVITDAPPAAPRDEYATLVPEPPAPKSAAPKPAAGGTELISAPPTNTAQLFEGTELLSASAPVAEVKPEPVSNRTKPEKQNKPDKSGKPGKKDKKDKPAPVADSGQLVEVPHTAVVSAAPVKKSGSQIVLLTGLAAVVLVGAFVAWKFLTKDNQPAPTPSQPVTQVSPAPVAAVPPGMVLIPGGEFKVGRDDGEENERPAHTVIVAPFYLDQHEVTNEQYLKFIEATGYLRPPSWLGQRYPAATDKLPVTDVTWEDANEYARWASKRLPTEEEWEIAARGADGRVYPWGNDWADDLANVPKDAADKRQLAPVGTYLRGQSFYGVLDLVGNAWEWTASDYKEYAGGKPLTIPEGYQNLKVIRGCSHGCTAKQATATYRRGWPAARKNWPDGTPANYMQTGFRCAQDAPQK